MHCYFVFAGDGELPILYHVERVVDTPGYGVRAVRAKQGDRLIFSATLNFTKSKTSFAEHALPAPVVDPPVDVESGWDEDRPFQSLAAGFARRLITPRPFSYSN